MKKIKWLVACALFPLAISAQNIAGDWEGKLRAGSSTLAIVFHISQKENKAYTTLLDVPAQKAFNISCGAVEILGDSVSIPVPAIGARFTGMLSGTKKLLGNWYQSVAKLPLELKRTNEEATTKTINRPQTPAPPFAYHSEELSYSNADGSIRYGGTFTRPSKDPVATKTAAYPVVLLITGSGKQDRDETMYGHKPFALIADYLAKRGFAVLRVDDRGMDKTTGDFNSATTSDFAKDVEAGIDYLKTRTDVDSARIGLLGHSEGGLIAPMVASRRAEVKFVILLAAPGVKSTDLFEQQSVDMLASQGVSPAKLDEMRPMLHNLVEVVMNTPDTALAKQKAIEIFTEWQKNESRSTVRSTTGVSSEKGMLLFVNRLVSRLSQPWTQYIMKLDPSDYLSALRCRVLALNGEKDIQVAPKINLTAIRNILEKNNAPNTTIKEMPGLNHLFQHCKKCVFAEYADLEETLAPEVLETIANWLESNGI